MKKSILLNIFVLLCGIAIGYSLSTVTSKRASVSKSDTTRMPVGVGALLPLTGTFAQFGEDTQNGLEIARSDIEARYGITFDIVYEDSAADPKIAVSAATKLATVDKVGIVVAGPGSSANMAVAPIFEDNKTVFIAISATPKLNEAGRYIFKVHPDIDGEVKRITQLMYDLQKRRVGLAYDAASETQTTGKDLFVKLFQELGGTVVALEGYDSKTISDFRTILTKFKAADVDAVYLLAIEKVAGLAVRQAREIGLTQQIFGWSAFDSEEFLKSAGDAAEGVIITAQPFSCAGDEVMQKYCDAYAKRFSDRKPIQYGAHAYDILQIIAETVRDNELTELTSESAKGAVMAALLKTKSYQGASGALTFDENGNVREKEFEFQIVQGGEFVLYQLSQ